ncbi:MAG: YeeE/YedE family protein [Clostridiales bacterium]|nr:YeeE/YedE family protein [Clostridiales bacterium]
MMNISAVSWVSLGVGLIFGFLAQRSRMCFIGGWRDFFLVRDTYLLKGFIAFFVTAALFFFGFWLTGNRTAMATYPWVARDAEIVLMPPEMKEEIWCGDEYPTNINDLLPGSEHLFGESFCALTGTPMFIVGQDVHLPGIQIFGKTLSNVVIVTVFAALLMGLFSVMANGCPIRQHVMAASGNISAMLYLLGFFLAILFFDKISGAIFEPLFRYTW